MGSLSRHHNRSAVRAKRQDPLHQGVAVQRVQPDPVRPVIARFSIAILHREGKATRTTQTRSDQ